ncbi:MAG: hypothetical protein K1X74_14180 [Pirellulales bacterium]|nr:hypothetical protein [Pirellulales bacterium]
MEMTDEEILAQIKLMTQGHVAAAQGNAAHDQSPTQTEPLATPAFTHERLATWKLIAKQGDDRFMFAAPPANGRPQSLAVAAVADFGTGKLYVGPLVGSYLARGYWEGLSEGINEAEIRERASKLEIDARGLAAVGKCADDL